MSISLDTIRSLDANKSYYLANSTGQIKEAGFWQKFKCFLGVGDGRAKVQNLIDAVKVALLRESGESDNAALTTDVDNYENNHKWRFSASGRSIAAIANRFAVASAEKIASTAAGKVCARHVEALMRETVLPCLPPSQHGSRTDIVAYLERAAKPVVDHPPTKELPDGRRVLDEEALVARLREVLDRDASTDLVQIAKSERLGCPRFDKEYLDHVFKTFYDGNGVRNDKTPDDLRPAFDVRLDKACISAPDEKRRPEEHAKFMDIVRSLLEKHADDPDALTYFLGNVHLYVFRNNGEMRAKDEVEAMITGIRSNFDELREVADGSKGVLRVGRMALRGLHGKPLPPGKIAQIAQIAKTVDLGLLEKLSPTDAGTDEINKAVMQLNKAVQRIFRETGFDNAEEAGNRMQYRSIICAFLLDRFPPGVLHRIDAALASKATAALMRAYNTYASEKFFPDEDWPVPRWDNAGAQVGKSARNLVVLLDSLKSVLDEMLGLKFQYIDEDKVKNVRRTEADYNVFCDIVLDAKADAQ